MGHPDADRLVALAAWLEAPAPTEQAHLDRCGRCGEEVERFRATISLLTSGDQDSLLSPPARVWDRVLSELGLREVSEPGGAGFGPDSPAGCGR